MHMVFWISLLGCSVSALRLLPCDYFSAFLDQVSCPHLRMQLRGLDSAILQATQAVSSALYYTQELMTTFGLIHTLTQSPEQLDAEPRTFLSPAAPVTRSSRSTTWISTLDTTWTRSRSGAVLHRSDLGRDHVALQSRSLVSPHSPAFWSKAL